MIRKAIESDFAVNADHECFVRILGLRSAYGLDVPFIQYFSDGEGGIMSLMDGVAVLHLSVLTDEWRMFLSMNPDVMAIHCSDRIGEELLSTTQWRGRVGDVMRYDGELPASTDETVCIRPYLPAVYELLRDHFPGISPLDYWYPDVSHRVRHENCHISVVLDDKTVVSTAMTVAETATSAILGQVATHPEFRRRGFAEKCIKSTIFQCKDKTLYILPINEYAQKLYRKMGFIPCGGWAELERA